MVKKTDFNTKVAEIEGKKPSITGLTTNSELTVVENKIPDVNGLIKILIMTQKLVKLKRKLLIMNMTNTLLFQNLILWQQVLLIQD